MKQLIYLAIAALAFAVGACSSSKQAPDKIDGAKLVERSRELKLAEDKPGWRAFGEARSASSISWAIDNADLMARGQFARGLSSAITSAGRAEHYIYNRSKTNNKKTTFATDEEGSSHFLEQTLSKINNVKGLAPISKNAYKQKNGQYVAYICLEYRGSIQELADQITNAYKETLEEEEYGEDSISQDKRDEIDKRAEEFRNSIKEELEQLLRQN